MKITKLPWVIGSKTVKDVKNIHSVASLTENNTAINGIPLVKDNAMYNGAPLLNHRGKAELIKRCKARLTAQAKKCGANAIICFSCVHSLSEGGSGLVNGNDFADTDEGVCACNMLAGGEAVIVKKQ